MPKIDKWTAPFFKKHYDPISEEPIDFIGRVYSVLFGNVLAAIFWTCLVMVSGLILLVMIADLVSYLIDGDTIFCDFGGSSAGTGY